MFNMTDDYKGYSTVLTSCCKLLPDGKWEATHTLKYMRSSDLENWEEKEVSSTSINSNIYVALKEAYATVMSFIDSIGGDLFTESKQEELVQ